MPGTRKHLYVLFLAFAFIIFNSVAAQIFTEKNFVTIDPKDDHQTIIRKAANVTPSPRQLRWQELEVTGFLHFGINTFTDKEWGNGKEDPKLFNPSMLDARQWIRILKAAGIKQVILTAKHHDGFCLWPSKYTDHSVKSSPWKKGNGDVVKEVAEACKESGVGFGVYLSPWDMNSPYFGDSAKYNDYFINQLTELLTNYGKVDEVWFDGANGEGPNGKKQIYDFNRWYAHIRKLQRDAVIAVMGPDVRWVGTETGFGRETEWSVVAADALLQDKIAASSQQQIDFAPTNMMEDDLGSRTKITKAKSLVWYPAETDVSIRPGWFYHPAENLKVKSVKELLDIYYSSVGRNGVLLLNIPPDASGLIHSSDINALIKWKMSLELTFHRNYLEKAKIKSEGKNETALVDGNKSTYWTTRNNDTTAVIEFNLKEVSTVDLIMLQEMITVGQRIEKFEVEYMDGGHWKPLANGTTVGYKRIIRFSPVTTKYLRIKILSSRLNPTLMDVGLYKQAGQ